MIKVLFYKTADFHWFKPVFERRLASLAIGRYCLSVYVPRRD